MFQVYFHCFDYSEYASTLEDARKLGDRKGWSYTIYKV